MALTFSKKRQRRLPILRLLALAIVALILLLGSNAFAKDTGNAKTLSKNALKGDYTARTICVDGYKFILANKFNYSGVGMASAISITQFYEERNGKALPAKCK